MHDVEQVVQLLNELKSLGVRLVIDDFRTGYSSLSYLGKFPIDVLKIDRAFVVAAASGAFGGEALIRSIVDIGKSLSLTTVAEGIEEPEQADQLQSLGCEVGQGFYFARPTPPAGMQH